MVHRAEAKEAGRVRDMPVTVSQIKSLKRLLLVVGASGPTTRPTAAPARLFRVSRLTSRPSRDSRGRQLSVVYPTWRIPSDG